MAAASIVLLLPTMVLGVALTPRVVPQQHSVALVALGCPKNTVDAEVRSHTLWYCRNWAQLAQWSPLVRLVRRSCLET